MGIELDATCGRLPVGGRLACAKNTEKVDEATDAAQDTTSTQAPPPGYSGMERDTANKHDSTSAPLDTFLNEQGTGVPADTQGYSGLSVRIHERPTAAWGGGRGLQPLTLPQLRQCHPGAPCRCPRRVSRRSYELASGVVRVGGDCRRLEGRVGTGGG